MGQVESKISSQTADGQQDFHAASREYWLSYEGLSSEAYFRERLFALVNDTYKADNVGDLDRIEKNLKMISWVEPLVQAEPFLSFYETGLVQATLPLASWATTRLEFDAAYELADRCRNVLIGKRNRRRELGLGYRPDSECWFRLYRVLGVLKWKCPEEMRDRVVNPENLICDYLKIERRCKSYLDGQPQKDTARDMSVLTQLGHCGVQIIKMAMRWCPQHVNVLIEDFNTTHGQQLLNRQAGHFLDFAPADPRNPWYWDLELYKWCEQGPATPDEANLCHQWHVDAMRSSFAFGEFGGDFSGIRTKLDSDLEFLLTPKPAYQHLVRP